MHPPDSPSLPLAFFFSCWGSSGDSSDTEKERGIRGRDIEGYIGGQGGPSPQQVDAAAKALAKESPIQLHGREGEGPTKERREMSGRHKENEMKEPKFLDSLG